MFETIIRWLCFFGGITMVIATARSIVGTIIIPRSTKSQIVYRAWYFIHSIYQFRARRLQDYSRQDAMLSSLGATSLVFMLIVWILFFLIGYALMFLPFIPGGLNEALFISGSSIFTLGIFSSARPGPVIIEFLASVTGLIVIALQVGYLPTIYGAYNRRETLVTALSGRAGDPAWGPEILARHQLDGTLSGMGKLYSDWETLAADINETHSSYPWLIVFRSPEPLHSLVTSLLAILDSAALYLALSPTLSPMEARQCLRMGFLCLRKVTKVVGVDAEVNDDPRPDDPIKLTYEQFSLGVQHLRLTGFPIERTTEEAWIHYKGWRVNYEAAAYALAEFAVAVPAPWSGVRLATTTTVLDVIHNRPRHRTPEDLEGNQVRQLENEEHAYMDEDSRSHHVHTTV